MELPADLLDRPAGEAVRRIALALLARAESAAVRLADPTALDPEALHDFRVAVRRLRSCLRAYREPLAESVSNKPLARLRALAAATNPGRDAEVQLAWLAAERGRIPPERRAGLDWLVAHLEAIREAGVERPARAATRWRKLSRRLRARLMTYERRLRPLEVEPLGGVLGALVGGQLEAFLGALATIAGPEDVAHAHRARIEGKRLRYLLEPARARGGLQAKPALERLRRQQDLLGELHDAHVLDGEIEAAREQAERSGTRPPALSPVTRLVRARRDRLFGALTRSGGDLEARAVEVKRVADRLAASGSTLWIARPADDIGMRDDHAPHGSQEVHRRPRPDVDVDEAAGEPG